MPTDHISEYGASRSDSLTEGHLLDRVRHFCAVRTPDTYGRAWFARNSATQSAIFDTLQGKTVALVGNACALMQTRQGAAIDRNDLVIRINNAPGLGSAAAGSKLNWLATAIVTRSLPVDRVLWIGRRVRKIPFDLMTSGRLYVHDAAYRNSLSSSLGARASTGIMTVDLLLRSPARSITLYGFDFYASRSLSGDHTIDSAPHNYRAEKDWIMAKVASEPRLTIVPTAAGQH